MRSLLCALCLVCSPGMSQPCEFPETQRLIAFNGESQGFYGLAAATDGSTMIVGAPGINDGPLADAGDLFAYLDLFAAGHADLDLGGDRDADDFFMFLDLFSLGC